jgi:hypothetical protein
MLFTASIFEMDGYMRHSVFDKVGMESKKDRHELRAEAKSARFREIDKVDVRISTS